MTSVSFAMPAPNRTQTLPAFTIHCEPYTKVVPDQMAHATAVIGWPKLSFPPIQLATPTKKSYFLRSKLIAINWLTSIASAILANLNVYWA